MRSNKRTIVVCGATGKQGGAVIDALLKHDAWNVVALSRNPDGPAATALRQRGVEVRRADLEDGRSLVDAFVGAYSVYGVTTPMNSKGAIDTRKERVQGVNIADACVANNVGHLVLSTVLFISDEQLVVPYVRSKQEIEQYVTEQGIPATFLCPASFMDEIGGEFLPVKKGVLTGQAANDAKVPYIACRDIGDVTALAFADRQRFVGEKLNLVGDFISGDDLAETLSRVHGGRPFKHTAPPIWLMWIFARQWITLRKQFESWGREPHPKTMLRAIDDSRRLLPDMLTFEEYLLTTGFVAPE